MECEVRGLGGDTWGTKREDEGLGERQRRGLYARTDGSGLLLTLGLSLKVLTKRGPPAISAARAGAWPVWTNRGLGI